MLIVISDIRTVSLTVEIKYRLVSSKKKKNLGPRMLSRDLKERYRTLKMYNIPLNEEELSLVDNIDEKWRELFNQAKTVDRSLIKVKKKFTLV